LARPTKNKQNQKALAKLTTDILRADTSLSDVGAVMACLESVADIVELKDKCKDIDEFMELAAKRADVALIVAAMKAAMGYDYIEEETLYRKVPKYDSNGCLVMEEIPADVKKRKKHSKPSEALLKFVLINRLPEYFSDSKKVEINKRTIEIRRNTEAEIKQFAGKLMEIIDTEFETDEN